MYNYGNKCLNCGKEIINKYRLTKNSRKRQKYCGRQCYKIHYVPYHKGTKGIIKPNKGSFKKGQIAPNKGKKLPKITGKKHWNWKGGRIIQQGYVYIKMINHPFANKNGYIKRSRIVMERKLGRYLKPTEIIHHINQIKTDDRIENLKLFSNKSAHSKFHRNNH